MSRRLHKLTARKVETAKPGRYGDGGGLWLAVAPSEARKWVFRFTWAGKPTEMGLGSADAVSLARAREKAAEARALVADGVNPIHNRREARRREARKPTFGEVADALIADKGDAWRNAKHKAQWEMTLTKYAAPIRSKPVDEIDTAAVLDVLKPLWNAKPETASRLRGRIEAVLDAAKAQGHRAGENPAAWRGHLDKLLPKRQSLSRGHHAAMPYAELPALVERLRAQEGMGALALEFVILTAARTGEAIGARWEEIDMQARVWTVPAARMKAGREHRVPLSARAVEILETLALATVGSFVFPGQRRGKPLSSMAMAMTIKRLDIKATVHGFRSAFRDWAGNETHFAREVAEAALAHTIGDKAEQAYRRSDALEKRRELMTAWANFIEPKEQGGAAVLPFQKSGGASA